MRFRGTLAYDGSAYAGFQRQRNALAVQDVVERALGIVLGRPTTVLAAGRTDAGVHASGQVVAFDAPAWRHDAATLLRALNAHLPQDVALQTLALAAPGFHPRIDARARTYVYTLWCAPVRQPLVARSAWQVGWRLDWPAMQRAAARLVGRQDFATLGTPPQGSNTVRTVFASAWHQDAAQPQRWAYTVQADAFLYRMVRRCVGMMVDVGRGALPEDAFAALLAAATLATGVTVAPPQGLVLAAVAYDNHDRDGAPSHVQHPEHTDTTGLSPS